MQLPIAETILLDEAKVVAFLRQCAIARLINNTTSATWSEFSGSSVLNGFYAMKAPLLHAFGGSAKPGFVELGGITNRELRQRASQHCDSLLRAYHANLKQGPAVWVPWMQRQHELFERDVREVRQTILEARRTNEEVDRELQAAIFNLATTKFVMECLLQCLGIVPFGALPGVFYRLGVGIGYPVLCSFISDWNKASAAKVVLSVASTGAAATASSVPSFASEGDLLKAGEAVFVDQKFAEAKRLLEQAAGKNAIRTQLRAQGLRGDQLGAAVKAQSARLVGQSQSVAGGATMSRLGLAGLKVMGPALQGTSCVFAYYGAKQSAQDYWSVLEEGGL